MLISNLSLNIPTIVISVICIVMYLIYILKLKKNMNNYSIALIFMFTLIHQILVIISLALNTFGLYSNVNDADNNMIAMILNVIFIVVIGLLFYLVNIQRL